MSKLSGFSAVSDLGAGDEAGPDALGALTHNAAAIAAFNAGKRESQPFHWRSHFAKGV
jgi:hypothetical protein